MGSATLAVRCAVLTALAFLAGDAEPATGGLNLELIRASRSGARAAQVSPILPDGVFPNLLRDPGFAERHAHWFFSADEAGVAGMVEFEGRRAHLSAERARTAGTVYLTQRVELPEGTTALDFRVRARDAGAVERYAYILREVEADGQWKDTGLDVPATRGTWREHAVRWQAKTRAPRWLIVHLRFVLESGAAGTVTFSTPSLREAAQYEWRVDGAGVPARPLVLDSTGLADGPHMIELAVHGSSPERRLFARLSSTFVRAPLQPVLEAPAMVVGEYVRASGIASLDPEARDLLPVWDRDSARQAWQLADETAGQASVSFRREDDGGTDAVVRVVRAGEKGGEKGAMYLLHETAIDSLTGKYQLKLRRRDDGSVRSYGLMVRELGVGPAGYVDSVIEAHSETNTPGWAWTTLTWWPRADTKRVQVMLRFSLRRGDQGEVRFRDVSLRPALSYHWDAAAWLSESGDHSAEFSSLAPGLHMIRFGVSRPGDMGRTTVEAPVIVVAEPPLVCAVGDVTRLLWRPGANLSASSFDVRSGSGEHLLGPLPGPTRGWVIDLPPEARGAALRVAPATEPAGGLDALRGERNRARGNTLQVLADTPRVNVGEAAMILVRTCGESLSAVPLIAGSRTHTLPVRAQGGGWYDAAFEPTVRDVFRSYRPWGNGDAGTVRVSLPPAVFLYAFYIAATVALIVAAVRRLRGRPPA